MRLKYCIVSLLLGTLTLTSCSSSNSTPRTLQVPADYATISLAVAQASPGDTILIASGLYHESVTVTTPNITIRGEDRNSVVLDGKHSLPNGFSVGVNNVAIENLTVHSYTQNGIVFNGIEAASGGKGVDRTVVYGADENVLLGYRASYVTAYNNGLYGVYAFASRDGLIDNVFASGHPDSGIYIGQCKPCNVVIRNSIADTNAIGYYGTNASGGVFIVNSQFTNNRLGVAPNSQDTEALAPQEETVIAGNVISNNANEKAPKISMGFSGGGIAIGGGARNTVLRNRLQGNVVMGIAVVAMKNYLPTNNRIEENMLSNNGLDLLYAPSGAVDSGKNCFAGNTFGTSLPEKIETVMACTQESALTQIPVYSLPTTTRGPDYRTIPAPGPQKSMPLQQINTAAGAGEVPAISLESILLPR
jgi:hypothetical protein